MINIRKRIDKIDKKLIRLFIKRFNYVKKVGNIKKQNKLPIKDSDREDSIIKNIEKIAKNNFTNYIIEIYRTIFKVSKELEKKNNNDGVQK